LGVLIERAKNKWEGGGLRRSDLAGTSLPPNYSDYYFGFDRRAAANTIQNAAKCQQIQILDPNPSMTTPTTTTSWPDAAPLAGEELIFSISCGNSHLHWATHFGEDQEFSPDMFWR